MRVYPFASVRHERYSFIDSKVTREKKLEKTVQSAMLVPGDSQETLFSVLKLY